MSKDYVTQKQLQDAIDRVCPDFKLRKATGCDGYAMYYLSHPSIDIEMPINVLDSEINIQASMVDHMPLMYFWQQIADELCLGRAVSIYFTLSTMCLHYRKDLKEWPD